MVRVIQSKYIDRAKWKVAGRRGGWTNKKAVKNFKSHAVRRLKNNPTDAEVRLMIHLGEMGRRFQFQKPFNFIHGKPFRVVDFFLPDKNLAIEADGGQHRTPDGIRSDQERGMQFQEEYPEIRFLRFRNSEIMHGDFKKVLEISINGVPLPSPGAPL